MFARTPRLLLRPAWAEDAPALAHAIGDERIVCNLASAPWPYTRADAEAMIARERRLEEPWFLIARRTAGAPETIGTIGIGRGPDGCLELGYWIARIHWGRGYATEAGQAVIDIARRGLRMASLSAGHFLDNPASGRVLEKLGFAPTGVIEHCFSKGRDAEVPCKRYHIALNEAAEVGPFTDCLPVLFPDLPGEAAVAA